MLQLIKRYFPESLKKPIRRALVSFRKPELHYLELHLTDHCNLDCKGCGHFSPLVSPYYTNVDAFEQDMGRLRHFFHNIRTIRLMGGEPLLHPEAGTFIEITRKVFPGADIRFVTNGILLTDASETFWGKCKKTQATIDVTVYPPLRRRVEELRSLCMSKGVPLNATDVDCFCSILNPSGSSDQVTTFETCRSKSVALPFLRNGRLYQCAAPALIHYFNNWFNNDIPADPGIDIYSDSLAGRNILKRLDNPIVNCKYCTFDTVPFPWSTSSKRLEEWDSAAQKNETGCQSQIGDRGQK